MSGGDGPSVPVGGDAPILEVMATMRAMRRLKPDPVPDDLLERLVEAATWAPSGSDLQSYEFVVVTERQLMARLAGLWGRSVDAYLASIGRVTPAARDDKVRRAVQFQREHFHETPALIVACYRSSAPRLDTAIRLLAALPPRDRLRLALTSPRINHLTDAASVYPGVQNLLLAARALGLGAVMTVWHLLLEHQWKRALEIPREVNTFAVVPVGWPRGTLGPVRRRPAAEVIHRNGW